MHDCLFLYSNKAIKQLVIKEVTSIGNSFLMENEDLNYINIDKVEYVGNNFLKSNKTLKKLVFVIIISLLNRLFLSTMPP